MATTQLTLTSTLNFETRTGCQMSEKDRLLKWTTRHASWLYNHCSVETGSSVTPLQILSGVQYTDKVTHFGATVLALQPTKDKQKNLDDQWRYSASRRPVVRT
jgi:hypothetical protein